MSSDRCREFDEGLRSIPTMGLERWGIWLTGFTGVEDCIADGLRRSRDDGDWRMFDLYVIAAQKHPSKAFTELLGEALRSRTDELNHEDIVDALAKGRDPAAVDYLEEAIWWEPDWDEFRALALKSVWALAAIGTPKAMEAIRDAAACADERTRDAAAGVIRHAERRGPSSADS